MNSRYKELSDKAFLLHKKNQLKEAEELYNILLQINPEDANILNLYGLLCISKGESEKAVSYLSKAVILNESAYTLSNLAKAYSVQNEYDKAVSLYKKAAELNPSCDIYYSLGIALKQQHKYDEAIEAYKTAVELNPNHYSSLYNLALLYKDTDRNQSALDTANKAFEINSNDEDILILISSLHEYFKDYEQSIKYLEAAVKINPKQSVYFYNLAVLNTKIGDKEKAAQYYKASFNLKPSEKNTALALAHLYRDMYMNEESIEVLKKYLDTTPDDNEAVSLLAVNCMDEGKYETALEFYNQAIKLKPDVLSYYHGKAIALKYLSEFEKSKEILEYVHKNDPNSLRTTIALGMTYLAEGKFTQGMELYLNRSNETKFTEIFKEKIWSKETDLKDKNILLYSDCGLGDSIMFSRYIPYLAKIAANIEFKTDKEIALIMKNSFKQVNVTCKTDNSMPYDVVMPIMNIAYALNMDFSSIPYSEGYLKNDEELINKYKNLDIFKTDNKKIGIFYQGNKRILKNRSLPYRYIEKLFDINNCNFYSFQISNYEEESNKVISLKSLINDYSDTAALLKCIDVLITIDTSIAHMAGALGVKTFLILPNVPEWRWFNDTNTTPWYKSFKIFKQDKPFDYECVMNKIKDEICAL